MCVGYIQDANAIAANDIVNATTGIDAAAATVVDDVIGLSAIAEQVGGYQLAAGAHDSRLPTQHPQHAAQERAGPAHC